MIAPLTLPLIYGDDLISLAVEFEESRLYYRARESAAKHKEVAGSIFQSLIYESEYVDMEMVWECIDHFHYALIELQNDQEGYHCNETAAMLFSDLGVTYSEVLKNQNRAHEYFLKVMFYADIVTHVSGSVFFNRAWYMKAKTSIEQGRKQREAFDAAEVEKQREWNGRFFVPRSPSC